MDATTVMNAEISVHERPLKAGLWGTMQKLFKGLTNQIPAGYEDENGFHYGVKPFPKNH